MNPWTVLGLEPGADRDAIRRAYAQLLKTTNPEEDPEGFRVLRAAYEQVLDRAAPPVRVPEHVPEPVPPEPDADPEIDDLNRRWQALMAGFAPGARPDPAALAELLEAPAMERVAIRAQVEGHVAHLIASNLPLADALVAPAIAGFGWGHTHSADRGDPAVNHILARDVHLHPSQVGLLRPRQEATETEDSQAAGIGGQLLVAFFLMFVIRFLWTVTSDDPPKSAALPLPIGAGIALPITPKRWFQGQRLTGIDRKEFQMTVEADVVINPDGSPRTCQVLGSIPDDFAEASCDLIMAHSKFSPADPSAPATLRLTRVVLNWDEAPNAAGTYLPTLESAGSLASSPQ